MKISIIGLGKMGGQFVEKLVAGGFEVIAYDKSQSAVNEAAQKGALPATSRREVVDKFVGDTVVVWLMIPSQFVDDEITSWQSVLAGGSILVDGGNSDFREAKKQSEELAKSEIKFLDVGVSGGVLGAKQGFSIMVGGPKDAYDEIVPILDCLAKPSGGHAYFGPTGSGHFIKMVHNAVEYGLMESLAEGYNLLKNGPFRELDLARIAEVWQHGSIVESSLNSLAEEVFSENPNLDGIEGKVAQTGETKWTLEVADELGVNMPAIKSAYDVRIKSESGQTSYATKLLAALRNKFGGHSENPK